MPVPTAFTADRLDLSKRIVRSSVVAASPAAASETIVCTVTIPGDLSTFLGVLLFGIAAVTVGTSGTAVNTRIRQTDTSGTILYASGALPRAAGVLCNDAAIGVDVSPSSIGQVYVLTLTVTAGAATSTVSAAQLVAIVV
jgi:hypothetical protein